MKKRLVQTLALACASALLVGCVAGCGSNSSSSTEKKEEEEVAEAAEEVEEEEAEEAEEAAAAEEAAEEEASEELSDEEIAEDIEQAEEVVAEDEGTSGTVEAVVDEWVIPVLSAETGAIAYVGKPASWAAQYAADKINEEGGINGAPVTLKFYDTQFDVAEVASDLSLVVDDSLIVVGPMDAPGGEVAGQIIYDAQIPNIGTYSYEDSRTAYAPYAIAYMSDSEEGEVIAAEKWLDLNPDIESVVIFTCPSDSSQVASTEMLTDFFEERGVEVKGVVEVETDTLDCGPAAVQALNYGADGYVSVLRSDENAKVVSELRTRGVDEGRRITCGFSSYSDNYLDVVGADDLDGTYIWNKLDPNYEGEDWQELVAAYQEDFDGDSPVANTVPDYYNAIMAIKQCFEDLGITGDPDKFDEEKEEIANWLYNSPAIHGIQGDFTWEDGKHVSDIYYFQFDGDTPVYIE